MEKNAASVRTGRLCLQDACFIFQLIAGVTLDFCLRVTVFSPLNKVKRVMIMNMSFVLLWTFNFNVKTDTRRNNRKILAEIYFCQDGSVKLVVLFLICNNISVIHNKDKTQFKITDLIKRRSEQFLRSLSLKTSVNLRSDKLSKRDGWGCMRAVHTIDTVCIDASTNIHKRVYMHADIHLYLPSAQWESTAKICVCLTNYLKSWENNKL